MWNVDVHEDIHTNKNLTFLKNCVDFIFLSIAHYMQSYYFVPQDSSNVSRVCVAEKFLNSLYVLFANLVGIYFPKVPLC